MNIRKLPSGNYQIREMIDGVWYSKTVKHRPKKSEAIDLIQEAINEKNRPERQLTIGEAMERYIEVKEHVLSPSTVLGYTKYLKVYPEKFKKKDMGIITADEVQAQVDAFARKYSGKYIHNLYGLLSASLAMFRPELNLSTITLPRNQRKDAYIPVDDDVKRLIKGIEGTEYEVAIPLAAYGIRRGEICALTIDDVKDGYIIVNKSKVQDKTGKWIINHTNTKSDEREVYIPKALEEKIRQKGYIFKYTPTSLTRGQAALLKQLGIEHFSPHKLRHYYASISHALGIPDAYILKTGGWKTDNVMKSVYRHALKDREDEMKDKILSHLDALSE